MDDGPPLNPPPHARLRRQWTIVLVASAAFFAWGVIDWRSGRAESYVGQHAGEVLAPLVFAATALGAMLRPGSLAGHLLRAISWGSLLAILILHLIGR
jgi:hypothetical protein